MDLVEVVIEIEHTFDIKIPDEEAAKILTMGDCHAYVVSHFGLGTNDPAQAWATLVRIVAEQAECDPASLTRETRFLDVFPWG